MTRLLLWLSGLAGFYSFAACADPVPIQAGEHSTFTRVVLELPQGTDWEVVTAPGKVTVDLSEFTEGFDISSVFSVIPRTRLANAEAGPDALTLQLECDCPLEYFFERGQFLVLDIYDGPPLPTQTTEDPVPAAQKLKKTSFEYGDLLWSIDTDARNENERPRNDDGEIPNADSPRNAENAARETLIRETRQNLMEAFSEATTRGLIEADLTQSMANDAVDEAPAPPLNSPETVGGTPTSTIEHLHEEIQIQITNSSELIIQGTDPAVLPRCPDPDVINVSNWGTSAPMNEQMGRPEIQLYDELGRLREDALVNRVKLLIYFGFGAEALQISQLSKTFDQEHPHLIDIANILEFGFTNNPREVHRYPHCTSGFSLWGVLAKPEFSPGDEVNAQAALQELEKLPAHLRQFLGQTLSKRFLDLNMVDEAGIALRSSQRTQPGGAEPSLASALVTHHQGQSAEATYELEEVIAENSGESPLAMIELVNSAVRSGGPISADVAMAVEGFAFELRQTDLGPELLKAHALASASSGQIQKAYEVRDSASSFIKASELKSLDSSLLAIITRQADDLQFLETTFNRIQFSTSAIENEVLLRAAQRLMTLGFPDHSEMVLGSASADFSSPEKSILLAEAAVAEGDGAAALNHLRGLPETLAASIRARAYLLEGDHESASQTFSASDNPNEALFALRTAENWDQLVPSEDPIFGPSRTVFKEDIGVSSNQNNLLSETEAALSSASDARGVLSDLITAVQP